MKQLLVLCTFLGYPAASLADVYSYQNADGDYVVSKTRPKGVAEYAVLTDAGEFLRLVRKQDNVPITHWRPWYLPREPHPFDGPDVDIRPREGEVVVEEVDEAGGSDTE